MCTDSAKAFLCKRLHKYKGFSLEYSELKGVDATTKLPFTEYKVRLAGVAELAPKAPMTKISRSFSVCIITLFALQGPVLLRLDS